MEGIYHFIVNPAAGGGRSGIFAEQIETLMNERKTPFRIWLTGSAADVVRFTGEAAELSPPAIVAVGGDGTASEVASVLAHSGIPMGIIGAGSGNDFAKSVLGKKKKLNLRDEINIILNGRTRAFDMVEMNGQPFLNIGNIGLDSDIAYGAELLKKRFGGSAYLVAAAKVLVQFRPMVCRITADGREFDGEAMLVAVCNGRAYGGGFLIAPQADASDGLITLCYIRKMPKAKLMLVFPTALFGKHTGIRQVEFVSCRECEISFGGEKLLTLDGNQSHVEGPLRFKVLTEALEVLV